MVGQELCAYPYVGWYQVVKDFSPTVFTVVVGAFAGWVALRQYRVGHAKLRLDLFERRYAIFEEFWKFLSDVAQNGTVGRPAMGDPITNLVPQARFLFGDEVARYILKASARRSDLATLEGRIAGGGSSELVRERRELLDWFHRQASEGIRSVFMPYLDFSKWR